MSLHPPDTSILKRLGLDRRDVRAWVMYDWANSAFMVVIVTAIFPNYFASIIAADLPPATAATYLAVATTIALAIVAVLAPILGAYADYRATRKRLLSVCFGLGVLSTACLYFVERGDWSLALCLFTFGNIGAAGSIVFYDSLLPHIAREDEIDQISTSGYALGYLGGGLLFAINVAWIVKPDFFGFPSVEMAVRISFVSVALWWLCFSIPLLRQVSEPPHKSGTTDQHPVRVAFSRLYETFQQLRHYDQALLMLVAFAIYNDGINTIIRMSSIYGTEIGISREDLMAAFLLVQFVGFPFAFLFGTLANKIGAKRAIFLALSVYTFISVFAYFMTTALHFYLLAGLVATVQGGSQALSRSLFASMIPKHKSTEFFGFFGVFDRFAGLLGPMAFAFVLGTTGASRLAILSIIIFFVVGAFLLAKVDVGKGQQRAREAEAVL